MNTQQEQEKEAYQLYMDANTSMPVGTTMCTEYGTYKLVEENGEKFWREVME